MQTVSKKQVLGYLFSPQLKSRFGALFANGFKYVPYFIALVYQIVRLLPANHPYLNPQNMGRFGVRHVIAAAANNLVINKQNIDQMILFFVVLMGFVLLIIQISLLILSGFVQPVMAGVMPTTFAGFFQLTEEQSLHDLAYIMLDMVFGVEGVFNSCVATGPADCLDIKGDPIVANNGQWLYGNIAWPYPIHRATQQLFLVYSTGLLVVAAFIASYFIVTIIAETAQTGTAFGKRFNKVWAPIRIIVAIGLLVPISQGINASQYIVLYSAKFGSAFATNGWNIFNDTLNVTVETSAAKAGAGGTTEMVARPNPPELASLLQMMFTAQVCRELELKNNSVEIRPYLVRDSLTGTGSNLRVAGDAGYTGGFTPYSEVIDFANGDTQVIISFGEESEENYSAYKGNVKPTCGQIALPLMDPRDPAPAGAGDPSHDYADPAATIMQSTYWQIINLIWFWHFYGEWDADLDPADPTFQPGIFNYPLLVAQQNTGFWEGEANTPRLSEDAMPKDVIVNVAVGHYRDLIHAALVNPAAEDQLAEITPGLGNGAIAEQLADPRWAPDQALAQKGWAGAAIWYNRIAELNGSLTAATYAAPYITLYPEIMEDIQDSRKKESEKLDIKNRFNPTLQGDKTVNFSEIYGKDYAAAMWAAYKFWQAADGGAAGGRTITRSPIIDIINQIFGTSGLFDMRENANVHPLAQLTNVGRSLIQASTNALGLSSAIAIGGAAIDAFTQNSLRLGEAGNVIIGPLMTIVIITMTIGFVLFYVVPFLPFIYFFFALGGWVKGIFEAMVGAPLWALAHIRIDGNGLPGQAAVNGYFLIFEIFLRPILIIFGLLASISIFSALVSVLNDTWDIVTVNLAGFDHEALESGDANIVDKAMNYFRGPVDTFFFTLVYAIVVYMMGMSSFKLIDLIPNNILRWMGQSVSTFNDQREDAAQGLVGKAGVGGQQAIQSIGGGAEGALKSMAEKSAGKSG